MGVTVLTSRYKQELQDSQGPGQHAAELTLEECALIEAGTVDNQKGSQGYDLAAARRKRAVSRDHERHRLIGYMCGQNHRRA